MGIQKKAIMGDKDDTFTNIFQNAILPVDPRKMKVLMGSAQYIAVEVLLSQLIRRFMKAPQSWTDTILVHTLSMPFMGGAAGFFQPLHDGGDQRPLTFWSVGGQPHRLHVSNSLIDDRGHLPLVLVGAPQGGL